MTDLALITIVFAIFGGVWLCIRITVRH